MGWSQVAWWVQQIQDERSPARWLTLIALVAVVGALTFVVVRLRAPSRRWAARNRLHSLESRNEQATRREASSQLDGALRELRQARRDATQAGRIRDGERIDRLLGVVESARLRVLNAYTPSRANSDRSGADARLDRLRACEALAQAVGDLASQYRTGRVLGADQVADVDRAVHELTNVRTISS